MYKVFKLQLAIDYDWNGTIYLYKLRKTLMYQFSTKNKLKFFRMCYYFTNYFCQKKKTKRTNITYI